MAVCYLPYPRSLLLCITSLQAVHESPPDCSRAASKVVWVRAYESTAKIWWFFCFESTNTETSTPAECLKRRKKNEHRGCRTDCVVWISVVDGQAVLLPADIGLRMSNRRATVEDCPLPLGHLHITGLQTELLLQRCNNKVRELLTGGLQTLERN